MTQRMPREARRTLVLTRMQDLAAAATTQRDFAAARVAQAAGISVVFLYRLVGPEYKALRAQLPGPRKTAEEELQALREANAALRHQLQELRQQGRSQGIMVLKEAIILQERLEEENLALRGRIRVLLRRLEETGGYVTYLPGANEGET